jgi:hypothetical protein
VEISRKTQFNSVAGDKHIHQHADREYWQKYGYETVVGFSLSIYIYTYIL